MLWLSGEWNSIFIFFFLFLLYVCALGAGEVTLLLEAFIRGIRERELFAHAWIIFCCERNMAHEGGFIAKVVLSFKKTRCVSQHEGNDYGWWTNEENKSRYAFTARDHIMHQGVRYVEDLICMNPWMSADTRAKETREKFENQMRHYLAYQRENTDPLRRSRVGVSGKITKDGRVSKTAKDDLMLTFTLNLWIWDEILAHRVDNFPYHEVFSL